MFWVDEIVQKLDKPQHVDDMTTPSGYSHVGSLVGPILHDVVYKAFLEKFPDSKNTYVFNDFDPIDGLPVDLKDSYSKYMGMPTRMVPAPYGEQGTFGEYFSRDFRHVLESLGVDAEYYSSWDMYREGKFNDVIREALDHAEDIQDVYHQISGSKKKALGWYPFQVICPKCEKLGTTKVTGWDGEKVTYTCEKDLVSWADGCGHIGTMSPFDGNGKLPWKVDWPAHWKVMSVTFEGAGKDHGSAGGSYDIAFELCNKVFDIPQPYHFVYEFFLFGGKKMSSSKGIGVRARDITKIIPPELVRFLLIRNNPKRAIEFDPDGMTIPDLFDEFDRCAADYWSEPDAHTSRAFHFAQMNDWYSKKAFIPRFRDVANVIQLQTTSPRKHFEQEKGSDLSAVEQSILDQRIAYANTWIEKFAPDHARFTIKKTVPREAADLSTGQKAFLTLAADIILEESDPEKLQSALYESGKKVGLNGKQTFQALYIALLGKSYGPKAAWFILNLEKDFVVKRFREVS